MLPANLHTVSNLPQNKPLPWEDDFILRSSFNAELFAPDERLQSAYALSRKNRDPLSVILEILKISDEEALYSLAKYRVTLYPDQTAAEIQEFTLADPDHLYDLALQIAAKGHHIDQYIHHFGLKSEHERFEIAKIWAAKTIPLFEDQKTDKLKFFSNFAIESEDLTFDLLKLCAASLSSEQPFDLFKFTNLSPNQLVEIINLFRAHQNASITSLVTRLNLAAHPIKFSYILNLLRHCSKDLANDIAANIKKLGFFSASELEKLALACAKEGMSPKHLEQFALSDETYQKALLLTAEENFLYILQNFSRFRPRNTFQLEELFIACADANWKETAIHISYFKHLNETLLLKFAKNSIPLGLPLPALPQFKFSEPNCLEIASFIFSYNPEKLISGLSHLNISDIPFLSELFLYGAKFHPEETLNSINCFKTINEKWLYQFALQVWQDKNFIQLFPSFNLREELRYEVALLMARLNPRDLLSCYKTLKFTNWIYDYNLFITMSREEPDMTATQVLHHISKWHLPQQISMIESCLNCSFFSLEIFIEYFEVNALEKHFPPHILGLFYLYTSLEYDIIKAFECAVNNDLLNQNQIFNFLYFTFSMPETCFLFTYSKLTLTEFTAKQLAHLKKLALNFDNPLYLDKLNLPYGDTLDLFNEAFLTRRTNVVAYILPILPLETSLSYVREFFQKSTVEYFLVEGLEQQWLSLGSAFSNLYLADKGTLTEIFFFHPPTRYFAIVLLLSGEATCTSRIAKTLLLEYRATSLPTYREVLIKHHVATVSELDAPNVVGDINLTSDLLDARLYLENALRLSHLNPLGVDLNRVFEIKVLKDQAKKIFSQLDPASAGFVSAQESYQRFVAVYDRFTEKHVLLHELRLISREIRAKATQKKPKFSARLLTFFGLSHNIYKDYEVEANLPFLFSSTRKAQWHDMVKRCLSTEGRRLNSWPLFKCKLKWGHGTTSHALINIMKDNGLTPGGMLFSEGKIPLTGEISGSHLHENKTKLSGEILSTSWHIHTPDYRYHDAITNFSTSILYATLDKGGFDHRLRFDPEQAKEWLTTKFQNLHHGDFHQMRVQILRLRMTCQTADNFLSPFLPAITNALSNPTWPDEIKKTLLLVADAFTNKLAYCYTPEELSFITERLPFPILFASTTAVNITNKFDNIIRPEYFLEGKQFLGKDLQLAFTHADNVTELAALLNPFGVEVFDMEMAAHLELMSIIEGTQAHRCRNLYTQKYIAVTLQNDVLPRYAAPFAPKPTYVRQDKVLALENPSYFEDLDYASYVAKVESGEILARAIHGPMHAVRVAIWCQLLANIREKFGGEPLDNRIALALAGAAHDIARLDEGEDLWDAASAAFLNSYIGFENPLFPDSEIYVHALKEKDPADRIFTSDVQRIIHDADCLEILRCLNNFEDFRLSELTIMDMPGIDKSLILNIVREVAAFIDWSEDSALKKTLEQESPLHYEAVLKMITAERFPLLFKFLRKEIYEITRS